MYHSGLWYHHPSDIQSLICTPAFPVQTSARWSRCFEWKIAPCCPWPCQERPFSIKSSKHGRQNHQQENHGTNMTNIHQYRAPWSMTVKGFYTVSHSCVN